MITPAPLTLPANKLNGKSFIVLRHTVETSLGLPLTCLSPCILVQKIKSLYISNESLLVHVAWYAYLRGSGMLHTAGKCVNYVGLTKRMVSINPHSALLSYLLTSVGYNSNSKNN